VWRDNGSHLKLVRKMPGNFTQGKIVQSASSPNGTGGREVALLFSDSTICMFDADCFAMTRQYILPATEGDVHLTDFDVSIDGKWLVASGRNSMLYLWDMASDVLVLIAEMPPSVASVVQLEFSKNFRDPEPLYVLGDDGRVLSLTFNPGGCVVNFEIVTPNQTFTHFSADPEGKYAAGCTSTGEIRMYDLGVSKKTAQAVRDARKRMGMSVDQIEMSLHTRTPFFPGGDPGSSQLNHPVVSPKSAWAAHAEGDNSDLVVGGVKSDLIEGVFNPHLKSESRAKMKKRQMEERGESVLRRQTIDYQNAEKKKGKTINRWEPLYRLARLDPTETRLNTRKLKSLLDSYGEYPQKYRLLCWRFLLQLPENHDAFATLANKDIHQSFVGLTDRYPLKNQRVFKKFQSVLSALAHWSPVFGEAEFVPALAYPFVSLFHVDDLAAFETVMAVLLHWGGSWLQTFPHPPIPALNTVEQIIHSADPKLMSHLCSLGVSSQVYAWSLLRSVFTEVLNKSEWLRLWDHLFTNSHDPSLLLCAVAAYSVYNRNALIASVDKKEVEPFYRRQNPINMGDFVLLMYELRRKTPLSVLPKAGYEMDLIGGGGGDENVAGGGNGATRGKKKQTKEGRDAEEGGNVLSSVLSSPTTPWPLPRGMYPVFHGYPKFVVDFQIAERNRLAAEEEEVRRKRRLLEALGERSKGLANEEEAWQKQQEALIQAEETRRKTAEESEQKRLEEEKKLNDISRERRLAQIEQMEEAAQKAMQSSQSLRAAESKRIDDEIERVKQRAEYQLKQRQEEEALLNLENQTSNRVRQLQVKRSEEERSRELRSELKSKEDKMILDDKLLFDKLKVEDEERRLAAEIERSKREKLVQIRESIKTQHEVNLKFVEAAGERETKLAEIERERRLRHLAEDEAKRKADEILEIEKQADLEKQQEVVDMEQLVADARSWRQQQERERMGMVEEERRRYILESEVRSKRLEELGRSARRREYEKKMVDQQQGDMVKTMEEEKQMQSVLLTMEQDRVKDRLHEMRMQFQEEERRERAQFQNALQGAEERIVAEERRRFIQIREELRERAAEQEKEIAAAHEERMRKLAGEQKEEMDRIKEMIRKKVQLQEASSLSSKYTEGGGGEGGEVLKRARAQLEKGSK